MRHEEDENLFFKENDMSSLNVKSGHSFAVRLTNELNHFSNEKERIDDRYHELAKLIREKLSSKNPILSSENSSLSELRRIIREFKSLSKLKSNYAKLIRRLKREFRRLIAVQLRFKRRKLGLSKSVYRIRSNHSSSEEDILLNREKNILYSLFKFNNSEYFKYQTNSTTYSGIGIT
ncbi:MAG: hypothetical protein JXR10_17425 [Cyclobacteriaceae bacterium]